MRMPPSMVPNTMQRVIALKRRGGMYPPAANVPSFCCKIGTEFEIKGNTKISQICFLGSLCYFALLLHIIKLQQKERELLLFFSSCILQTFCIPHTAASFLDTPAVRKASCWWPGGRAGSSWGIRRPQTSWSPHGSSPLPGWMESSSARCLQCSLWNWHSQKIQPGSERGRGKQIKGREENGRGKHEWCAEKMWLGWA